MVRGGPYFIQRGGGVEEFKVYSVSVWPSGVQRDRSW